MIHVVLIATGKVIIDALPGVTPNISWTAVNLTYLAVRSFLHIPCTLAKKGFFSSTVFILNVPLGDRHPVRHLAARRRL